MSQDPFGLVLDALISHHGEAVTYKGDGSLNEEIVAVFDEVFTMVDPVTSERITSDQPSILLKLSDLSEEPFHRARVDARGKVWAINRVEKDGKGGARIFLIEKDV